ncbi:MAG TPA: hypothetical protein VHL54_06485 [Actinomycetota bacterium]|nr:hypothetical protein [Actinomycetota bacterium]
MRKLLVITAMVFLLAGCAGSSPTTDPTEAAPGPSTPEVAIDWSNRPSDPILLSDDFSVQGCEGEGPFLCVSHEGQPVGAVEYFSFQAPGGDPADALRTLVADDYETFTADRSAGCPEGYEVRTEEPGEAVVGGEDGLRSEYSVVDGDGSTVERYVKFWAVSEGRVHLLSAEAQAEGSCAPGEGVQFTNELLTGFEPSFSEIARGSRFPTDGG